MIKKMCPRCHVLHPVGTECPNGCFAFSKKEYNKHYDKYKRKNKEVYHSANWEKLRRICLMRFDSLCIYSLFKYNRAIEASMVHHIIEIEEDRTQQFELNNLIPLCDAAHREIHSRYKEEDKKAVQEELRRYMCIYLQG